MPANFQTESHTEITNSLQTYLVNTYALFLKSQVYHWNVQGPHFRSLHILFEELYEDLFSAIDELAERIRSYDVLVPANFANLAKHADPQLHENNEQASPKKMLKDTLESLEKMIKLSHDLIEFAEKTKPVADDGLADLITAREKVYMKFAWMVRSQLADY